MFDNLFAKRGVSLERLKTFLEVAQAGSIVDAAKGDLNRQSQYSRQIKELEEFFGTALADRRGKFLKITPMGRKLANIITQSFSGLSDLQNECVEKSHNFSIGGMDSVLEWIVCPFISDATTKNSKWTFSVERHRNVYSYNKLVNMELDFAVITKDTISSDIISYKSLGEISYSIYAHKKILSNLSKKNAKDSKFLLENLPVASLIDEYNFTKVLMNQYDAFSIRPNIVLKVHTFQYLLKLIKTSNFIGILPDVAKPEIPKDIVKISAFFLKAMTQNIVLAWNKRNIIIRPELKNVATYLLENSQKS